MTTTTPSSPIAEVPSTVGVDTAFSVEYASPKVARRRWMAVLLAVILIGAIGGYLYLRGGVGKPDPDTFGVTPRDFTVVLHEKGELKASKSIDVKCEVEGRSTIIWLIPEGTEVAEGDLLVKLASEEIEDKVRAEEIKEANAKAAAEAAAKGYDITLDEQASQVRKAELALQNAQIELQKYQEGDWVQEKTDADLAVKRAREVYRQKEAELQDSRELFEQYLFSLDPALREDLGAASVSPALREAFAGRGIPLSPEVTVTPDAEQADRWLVTDTDRRYHIRLDQGEWRVYYERNFITKLDLERAEFALLEAEIELQKALLRKDILHKYTNPKDSQQKTSDVEEAQKELERTRKSAEAKIAQSLANKEATAAEYAFVQQRLEKFRRQQSKTEIRAPAAGLVVYETGRSRYDSRQIAEGAEVFERQTIIKLPDTAVMQATVRIHEGKATKVKLGQKARVEIEGLPGVIVEGEMTKIAPLADSQNSWINPELKEYETELTLGPNTRNLKPGATARVEILVEDVSHVLAVPVQAVVTKQGRRYVFRGRGDKPEPVQVELGRSNDEYAEVLQGLTSGDLIRMSVNEADLARIPELPPEAQEPANGPKLAGGKEAPAPTAPPGPTSQKARGGSPRGGRPGSGRPAG